jgi:uncharacterized protein (DUF885 family)
MKLRATRLLAIAAGFSLLSCGAPGTTGKQDHINADTLYARYWEERAQLFPLEATASGDNRYNDRMTIPIAESFRDSLRRWYTRNLKTSEGIDTAGLDPEQLVSYKLFRYEMQMGLEGLRYPTHYLPFNQFWGLNLDLPLLASGTGNQPFKTVGDYDRFLKRLSVFPAFVDTAIRNMEAGIQARWVLPKVLVGKMLPQIKALLVPADSNALFGAVKLIPKNVAANEKTRITGAYRNAIERQIRPAYQRLYDYLSGPYMEAARESSGINALPNGEDYYQYLIKYWTTTTLTPDSIYRLGLREVQRIEAEMLRVKETTGFQGTMPEFFKFLNTDKQFFPFRTPKQVLDSFAAVQRIEEPALKRLFNHTPKTQFTIRRTEAFREASASAEYNPAAEDGSRPGIFYVPIPDATKFNAVGMETLFLHEAIPGHHYQISLQQENSGLPKFRRFLWYGAYGEGWALYSESLGRELGVFQNPYQYFGHLSDAMHRAIRLVVDAGLHSKGMTREEAIRFMLEHEATTEEGAVAEIERYMAIPGQALSYKIGQLAIAAERARWEDELGQSFNLAAFHDVVLGSGCVPLNVLSQNLQHWAAGRH